MAINLDHVTEQITVTDTATNASLTVQPKGTGAFNIAAGSSGVNLSNGGTVTALTIVNTGGSYTTLPTVTISVPTTAGGVQATANPRLFATAATVQTGGTGYTLNDVVTIVGGTPVSASATFTVTGVSGGAITSLAPLNYGTYTAVPTNPVSITGGTGSSATLNPSYGVISFVITNAGSGYVEQPTVTITGGGGAAATAYASVGGASIVRSIGNNLNFSTPSGIALSLYDASATTVNYFQMQGRAAGAPPLMSAGGSDTNINFLQSSKGTGQLSLYTNTFSQEQVRVTHTASAVNYHQFTGSATGFGVVHSAQGSDTNIPLVLQPKGTGALQAQQTDSTATGGNARGANAVDWSTGRNAATQVASGIASTVSGGRNNTASGIGSVVAGGGTFAGGVDPNIVSGAASVISGGAQNTNSGFLAVIAGGYSNTTSNSGTVVSGGWSNVATGQFSSTVGGYGNNASGIYNFIGGGYVNSGTTLSIITTQSATMNGTTAVTLSSSNASIKVGQYIVGTYISGDTYVAAVSGTSLTLSKVASGSGTATLSFYTPHGVVVGGGNNTATGSYSFIGGGGDAGTAANRNVASGPWSAVVGGIKNTASGEAAFVGGGGSYSGGLVFPNTASGNASVVVGGINHISSQLGSTIGGGYGNIANSTYGTVVGGSLGSTKGINGNTVFAAQQAVFSQTGSVQAALLCLATSTSDATATRLVSDNTVTPSTANQVILPNNAAYFFTGEVVAGVTGGGNTKGWTIEGVIKRGANAAATTLVGSTVTSTYGDVGASTWAIAVTADTTNGGLAVTFTGQASTTIRTVAQIRTTEMTY